MPDTVDTVIWAPDDRWRYHPKHVEQFADINKLYIVASCWIIIDTYYAMHAPLNIKYSPVTHGVKTWSILLNAINNNGLDNCFFSFCLGQLETFCFCLHVNSTSNSPLSDQHCR